MVGRLDPLGGERQVERQLAVDGGCVEQDRADHDDLVGRDGTAEAEVLAAAGRKEEAQESLRALLADEKLDKRTRETATKLLDTLP